jgi:hypothetical protein
MKMNKYKTQNIIRLLSLIFAAAALIACENNVEPENDSFVGFWKAEEISQHFWLDENIDSLTGFGQLARVNASGFLEWIPIFVEGTVNGVNISLAITYSDSVSAFEGNVITSDKFVGTWITAGDTISITYNKRIGK